MEGKRKAFADAVVGEGEHIGASEAEDEEHFDGPGADAADGGETGDDFFVRHATDACQSGDGAVERLGGEIAKCENLALRDAGGAKLIVGGGEQVFGGGVVFAEGFEQALKDGRSRLAVELLVDDGFEQGLKRRML